MPSFGSTSTSTNYTNIENAVVGTIFALSRFGRPLSITADINCSLTSKNMKCAIYDIGKKFIIETEEKLIAAGHNQITFNFNVSHVLSPTTGDATYWLVAFAENGLGVGEISYEAGPPINEGMVDTETYPNFPEVLNPTFNNNIYNLYCTYEEVTPAVIEGLNAVAFKGDGSATGFFG